MFNEEAPVIHQGVQAGGGSAAGTQRQARRTKVLTGKDGKTYEVLYYYTDLKAHDDKITNDELTPVVLQDGNVGWGYPFLDQRAPLKPTYSR